MSEQATDLKDLWGKNKAQFEQLCQEKERIYNPDFEKVFVALYEIAPEQKEVFNTNGWNMGKELPEAINTEAISRAIKMIGLPDDEGANFKRYAEIILQGKKLMHANALLNLKTELANRPQQVKSEGGNAEGEKYDETKQELCLIQLIDDVFNVQLASANTDQYIHQVQSIIDKVETQIALHKNSVGIVEYIDYLATHLPNHPKLNIYGRGSKFLDVSVIGNFFFGLDRLKAKMLYKEDGNTSTSPIETTNIVRQETIPIELDTDRARKYFARAIELGYMERTDTGYKWKKQQIRLGYFCLKVFEPPRPIKVLETLFGVRKLDSSITQASYEPKRADVKKWRTEMDNSIFC